MYQEKKKRKKKKKKKKKIQEWCNKWRMKLSLGKTEVTLFLTKDTCEKDEKECVCKANGEELKYNPNPKILGINLDEQLNFQEHVNKTEKKASIEHSQGSERDFQNIIEEIN